VRDAADLQGNPKAENGFDRKARKKGREGRKEEGT